MKLEYLRELVVKHKGDPHYQYRDLDPQDFRERARKSYDRLPEAQKTLVQKSWHSALNPEEQAAIASEQEAKLAHIKAATTEEEKVFPTPIKDALLDEMKEARFLAQTNLFFLCHLLETYKQTTYYTHEDICNEFFVQKDPTYFSLESFANEYQDLKRRMLLVPRNGFKSSIDVADCVQYTICYPEVTIMIMTGTLELATLFVKELRGHFEMEQSLESDAKGKAVFQSKQLQDKTTGEWSRSFFQILFPEHRIKPDDGKSTEYNTPACLMGDKEPTVRAASIEQTLSGMHFGVMKLDDVVTNENSTTRTRIENVNKQISVNRGMLNPYGFIDVIGTWYDECLVAGTLITMGDWSHKPIEDIKVGDQVVGFTEENGKRSMLVRSKVTHIFEPSVRKVFKYTFLSGRSVVSTDTHLWWKGSHGSGRSYKKIGLGYNNQKYVRRLLTPSFPKDTREHGYLAGLYDGEGSFQKNPNHPSGTITICQTQHNPEVVDSMRTTIEDCGFEITEYISQPEGNCKQKHEFKFLGGWETRYKFIAEVNPTRRDVIEESLYGQNKTEKDYLVSIEEAGEELTYCFETETHNYLADGCCSHNCDFYGETLKKEEQLAAMKGLQANIQGSIDSGRFNSSVQVKCYVRSCWWPKPGAKGKADTEMTKDDYIYWFPERLTWEWLNTERESDEWGFAIKYLNNPRIINKVRFPRELLIKRTIPHTQLPPQGMIVTCVDTAYSTKSWADYTVIMTAMIYGGRFYIINMKRGRWNEYELPIKIAEVAYTWKPKRISIEESVGVAWLVREVRREMAKHQVSVPLDLVTLGKGSKQKNKAAKAKPVIRLLNDERIYFLMSCEGREEIYNELELFTGTKDDQHDDIVSAISLLVDQYASYANMDAAMPRQSFVADHLTKARHDMIYGLGRYASQGQFDDNPTTAYQLESVLENRVSTSVDTDPLADAGLFG